MEELKDDVETIRTSTTTRAIFRSSLMSRSLSRRFIHFVNAISGPTHNSYQKERTCYAHPCQRRRPVSGRFVTLHGNHFFPMKICRRKSSWQTGCLQQGDASSGRRQDHGPLRQHRASFANVIPQFNIDQDKKTVAIQIESRKAGNPDWTYDISGNNRRATKCPSRNAT